MKKKVITIIVIILIIISNSIISLAIDTSKYQPTDPRGYTEFINIGGNIVGIIQFVGILATVLVITIIGIKYMLGSVEEKAEYKKSMLPIVIGCVLLMSSTVIVGAIANAVSEKNTGYSEYGGKSATAKEQGEKDAKKFIAEKNERFIIQQYFDVTKKYVETLKNNDSNGQDYYGKYGLTLRNYIHEKNLDSTEEFKTRNEEHQKWLAENPY